MVVPVWFRSYLQCDLVSDAVVPSAEIFTVTYLSSVADAKLSREELISLYCCQISVTYSLCLNVNVYKLSCAASWGLQCFMVHI